MGAPTQGERPVPANTSNGALTNSAWLFYYWNNSRIESLGALAMTLDQRAADLGVVVQEILKQFQDVNAAAANGPHVALNQQELRVVEFLGRDGPQMMRALAEYLSLAVNSVTTIADGLEQKELIHRQRSDEDRRVVRVELSDRGREAFEASEAAKMQLFRSMLSPLTVDEQEILLVLFRKIARGGPVPDEATNAAR